MRLPARSRVSRRSGWVVYGPKHLPLRARVLHLLSLHDITLRKHLHILYIVYYILYIVYFILYIVYFILYIVYCILYISYCILYIVYYIVYCYYIGIDLGHRN
jgi:hypothetical protein